MKPTLILHSFLLTIICALVSFVPVASAKELNDFITELKIHYAQSPQLETFALNYHYLGGNSPYQSWDYEAPERYIAIRMVEIDLVKKQFFENDIHHFSGGRTFDRIQFQNDKHSMFYDRNGLALGKRIIQQSMNSFEDIKGHIFLNVDFLAVTPLLSEETTLDTLSISIDAENKHTLITHNSSIDGEVEYTFAEEPLRLVSINKKSQQRLYVYGDYQSTNGITFARSILKYFDNSTQPSFIHRIDQLHKLTEIDPNRFEIPDSFGPIIPEGDDKLSSKLIAPNLYLVATEAGWRNVLFKVNGDKITVFGAPISSAIAEQTIKLITEQFPNKTISAVYVTHFHRDHTAGLPAYVKRGIPILADNYTIQAIKANPEFANIVSDFRFQPLVHGQLVNGERFYVLESSHAKRQSFVHFEQLGIIYQADFIEVAFDNSVAKVMPSYSKTFINFIKDNKLKFSRIVSHHRNNNISKEKLQQIEQAIW